MRQTKRTAAFRLLLACAVSVAALLPRPAAAIDGGSSWNEIQHSIDYARFPQIQFGSDYFPVNVVCVQGDHFRAYDPNKACITYGTGQQTFCVNARGGYVTIPRVSSQSVCTLGGGQAGCNPTYVTVSTPISYEVPVYAPNGSESMFGKLAFNKRFDIPACE